jgi:hypothetical protein
VTFVVLRRGRVLRVPVVLDARPLEAAQAGSPTDLLSRRQAASEQYWRTTFSALVNEVVG